MIATLLAAVLGFTLNLVPYHGYEPLSLLATLRFTTPVTGEVCLQLEALDPNSAIQFRESCESINGIVKQIRWRAVPRGEYRLRGKFSNTTERVYTQYLTLKVLSSD